MKHNTRPTADRGTFPVTTRSGKAAETTTARTDISDVSLKLATNLRGLDKALISALKCSTHDADVASEVAEDFGVLSLNAGCSSVVAMMG